MSTRSLVVTYCAACPFFEESPLKSGLLGILGQVLLSDSQHGICCLLPSGKFLPSTDLKIGLPPGPAREAESPRLTAARSRRVVEDKRTIPTDCPLRQADWTITLAADN